MVLFGQIIMGPPGSGKTTFCGAMAEFLRSLGRKATIINLDPANDVMPYVPDVNIGDLVRLEEVMERFHLGPNGGLIYCMEFLEKNVDWLLDQIKTMNHKDNYLLIDCPGQVELYTHNDAVKNVIKKLESSGKTRLVAVHLVDSHYCSDPGKFISVCLTSLATMLQIELPHINILSKADLIERYGKLKFNIDYYTEVLDLNYLLDQMDMNDPFVKKFYKLNKAITETIENYSLVNYIPLSVKNKEQMLSVKNAIDKANGYCFGSDEERKIRALIASGADFEYAKTAVVREKFMESEENKLGNDLDDIDIEPGFQI